MSVYVDALVERGWRLGPNCHLIADTDEELHALAARIGLKRSWFQDKSFPHYDLTSSRRKAAIRAGALPLDWREFVYRMRKIRAGRIPKDGE